MGEFAEVARKHLEGLRRFEAVYNPPGVSTDLIINEEMGVAVIGTQFSNEGWGRDRIYVFRQGEEEKQVLEHTGRLGGRMWPVAVSEDGKSFDYCIKYRASDDAVRKTYLIE